MMKGFSGHDWRSSRRAFLQGAGMGFGSLALGSLLARDGYLHASPPATPLPPARAKSVIWFFMVGGVSQMESFDPKPMLNRYAGKSIAETPYKDSLTSKYLTENLREVIPNLHKVHPKIYPMQVGYRRCGQSGIEISNWFPHLQRCADDLAVVRSMWTTDNNHGAQLQFHTGRHHLDGTFPTIGSWVHYGLGSLNDNLPQFVVLGRPIADCCGGSHAHGGSYLGPQHEGVQLQANAKSPLPFTTPGADVYREEQASQFRLLAQLHAQRRSQAALDPRLTARIEAYELAFHMQTAVPEVLQFDVESKATQSLYGLDDPATRAFGAQCLAARRLVERGVRFVQVFHGSNGGAGAWDAHSSLKAGHSALCRETDKPLAGLLVDLKRRGLLDETLVVWGTEFGRTPGAQGADGRDHHPFGFSVWLAGGGVRGGTVHGATDELGFHAVRDRHYVTDLHATVLYLLGLDARRLVLPGRQRLEMEFGQPITTIVT